MKVIIITPTRNEGKYIQTTLECMKKQTLLPDRWMIVNDGSTDNTEKIIKEYMREMPYIEYISLPDRGYRKPAQGVIETFYEGYKRIGNDEYDIVAKFDADLEFPPDTLERICKAFQDDSRLGITGGTRYEQRNNKGKLKRVRIPEGFVGGPTKYYRRQCFEDISGLLCRAGWNGVDIIKANMKGWKTKELDKLKIIHLKPTGMASGEGLKKSCLKYGDVSYYMGGYLWYFILRVIGRSVEAHSLKTGYFMVRGYLRSSLNNEVRETVGFRRYLKKVQFQNIKYWIRLMPGFQKLNNSKSPDCYGDD